MAEHAEIEAKLYADHPRLTPLREALDLVNAALAEDGTHQRVSVLIDVRTGTLMHAEIVPQHYVRAEAID